MIWTNPPKQVAECKGVGVGSSSVHGAMSYFCATRQQAQILSLHHQHTKYKTAKNFLGKTYASQQLSTTSKQPAERPPRTQCCEVTNRRRLVLRSHKLVLHYRVSIATMHLSFPTQLPNYTQWALVVLRANHLQTNHSTTPTPGENFSL